MHKTVSNGLTIRSLPQNLWKNVGIPKMEIIPKRRAYLLNIESQLQFPEALFRDLRQVF